MAGGDCSSPLYSWLLQLLPKTVGTFVGSLSKGLYACSHNPFQNWCKTGILGWAIPFLGLHLHFLILLHTCPWDTEWPCLCWDHSRWRRQLPDQLYLEIFWFNRHNQILAFSALKNWWTSVAGCCWSFLGTFCWHLSGYLFPHPSGTRLGYLSGRQECCWSADFWHDIGDSGLASSYTLKWGDSVKGIDLMDSHL